MSERTPGLIRLFCGKCERNFGHFQMERRELGWAVTPVRGYHDRAKEREPRQSKHMRVEQWDGRIYYRFSCSCGLNAKYRAESIGDTLEIGRFTAVGVGGAP